MRDNKVVMNKRTSSVHLLVPPRSSVVNMLLPFYWVASPTMSY